MPRQSLCWGQLCHFLYSYELDEENNRTMGKQAKEENGIWWRKCQFNKKGRTSNGLQNFGNKQWLLTHHSSPIRHFWFSGYKFIFLLYSNDSMNRETFAWWDLHSWALKPSKCQFYPTTTSTSYLKPPCLSEVSKFCSMWIFLLFFSYILWFCPSPLKERYPFSVSYKWFLINICHLTCNCKLFRSHMLNYLKYCFEQIVFILTKEQDFTR